MVTPNNIGLFNEQDMIVVSREQRVGMCSCNQFLKNNLRHPELDFRIQSDLVSKLDLNMTQFCCKVSAMRLIFLSLLVCQTSLATLDTSCFCGRMQSSLFQVKIFSKQNEENFFTFLRRRLSEGSMRRQESSPGRPSSS